METQLKYRATSPAMVTEGVTYGILLFPTKVRGSKTTEGLACNLGYWEVACSKQLPTRWAVRTDERARQVAGWRNGETDLDKKVKRQYSRKMGSSGVNRARTVVQMQDVHILYTCTELHLPNAKFAYFIRLV